jgi:hypothetical protein
MNIKKYHQKFVSLSSLQATLPASCVVVFMTHTTFKCYLHLYIGSLLADRLPIPVAARSKALGLRPLAYWDCGFESHRGEWMSVVRLCVVRYRSLRRADHSSRGVLPTVMRRVCDLETSWMWRPFSTVIKFSATKYLYICTFFKEILQF